MINITFPDGSVRSYEQGVTGLQISGTQRGKLWREW